MVDFENGKICTTLEDLDFFELILREWAGYNDDDIEELIMTMSDSEMADETLRIDGFDVLENRLYTDGETLTLKKVSEGEWIVDGYSAEQMDEFVESLQWNLV